MGAETMGRVVVAAKIENLEDQILSRHGSLRPDQVRTVHVDDALVDTGATMLALPKTLIEQLGLRLQKTKRMKTANGDRDVGIYSSVRLTIQERDCVIDVSELPDDCPTLIGQVPLELMDWVIDMTNQKLIGNPAHGGKWMWELY